MSESTKRIISFCPSTKKKRLSASGKNFFLNFLNLRLIYYAFQKHVITPQFLARNTTLLAIIELVTIVSQRYIKIQNVNFRSKIKNVLCKDKHLQCIRCSLLSIFENLAYSEKFWAAVWKRVKSMGDAFLKTDFPTNIFPIRLTFPKKKFPNKFGFTNKFSHQSLFSSTSHNDWLLVNLQ